MRSCLLFLCVFLWVAMVGCVSEPTSSSDASIDNFTPIPDGSKNDATMDASGMDGPQDSPGDVGSPKNFSCGIPEVCDFGKQLCCFTNGLSTGNCTNPLPDGGAPMCSQGQWTFACSATAQCAKGDVCCARRSTLMAGDSGPNPWSSACMPNCSGGFFTLKVLCNTTQECVSGTCQPVGSGFPNGYKECK